jgi:hypothetical protein
VTFCILPGALFLAVMLTAALLLIMFDRIDAAKKKHDKLASDNKLLQKYIVDLKSTSTNSRDNQNTK